MAFGSCRKLRLDHFNIPDIAFVKAILMLEKESLKNKHIMSHHVICYPLGN